MIWAEKELGCARRISRNKNVVKVSFAEKCILMLMSVLLKLIEIDRFEIDLSTSRAFLDGDIIFIHRIENFSSSFSKSSFSEKATKV